MFWYEHNADQEFEMRRAVALVFSKKSTYRPPCHPRRGGTPLLNDQRGPAADICCATQLDLEFFSD